MPAGLWRGLRNCHVSAVPGVGESEAEAGAGGGKAAEKAEAEGGGGGNQKAEGKGFRGGLRHEEAAAARRYGCEVLRSEINLLITVFSDAFFEERQLFEHVETVDLRTEIQ